MIPCVIDDANEDSDLTIFQLPEMLQEQYRRYHGRMTDVVAFELPITDDGIEWLESLNPGRKVGLELPANSVPEDVRSAVLTALPSDTDARYYEADSGRGASGWAVALELAGYVADVFGAGTAAWLSAQGVRHLYQRLTRALGRRPLISLGTAVFLAAADLSERLQTSEFSLHGRGDARTGSPDASYSGDDYFFVIFERGRILFSYLVDARGRVYFQGELAMRNVLDDPPAG